MALGNRVTGSTAAFLLLLLLSGCGGVVIPVLGSPSVGHLSGRIEQEVPGAAVVHIQAIGPRSLFTRRPSALRVAIEGGRQEPRIALVRPDQPLYLTNRDAIYHEIFTVGEDNSFRVRLASGEESSAIALRTPGFVRGYCRLHPHESYAFLVTEADHVVYLEDDSTFEVSKIPIGEYRIRATGLHGESEPTRFGVDAGETVEISLRIIPRVEN